MKLKSILIIVFYLSISTVLYAQKFTILSNKAIGTMDRESQISIIALDNFQFVIGCSTEANINGDKTDPNCDSTMEDIWIVKLDTSYAIQWNKSIGGLGSELSPRLNWNNNSRCIYFSCVSRSDSSCEKSENNRSYPLPARDYWVCFLDSNGNPISDKTFGGIVGEGGNQIVQLTTGYYVIAGNSDSPASGDKTDSSYSMLPDYWLVKMDSLGNKIWDKVIGGTGNEDSQNDAYRMAIFPLAKGDFIMAGSTDSPSGYDITDTSRGAFDYWIVKMSTSGNKLWDKRYGGNDDDRVERIIQAPDHGFVICGYTRSQAGLDVTDSSRGLTDCWLIKLDSLGNKQWDKRYGGNKGDNGMWIENAPGGGFWVSCMTNSDSSSDISENPYGTADYWIFKIDSAGNKLFDKRFGGPGLNQFPRFVILPDSSIMLCGSAAYGTSAVKTDPGHGDWDIWCVHFKYEDTLSTSGLINHSAPYKFATVHPNPANQFFTVKWSLPSTENILFYLYDATGRIVLTRNSFPEEKEMNINTQDIPSGLYFWKVSCQNHIDQNGKMVIMK